MPLIVLFLIVCIGIGATKLIWKPFVVLAALTVPGVALKISTTAPNLKALGEPTDHLYDPFNIIVACLVQWVIWSVVYLLGYAIGKWHRGRKRGGG